MWGVDTMTEYFLILKEELDKIVSGHITTKIEMAIRSRPYTPPVAQQAPEPQYLVINCPTMECPGNDCCSKGDECLSRAKINDTRKQQHDAAIRQQERERVLEELNLWRIKRMNGMLKKNVWQGWNDETDFIESLRSSSSEVGK